MYYYYILDITGKRTPSKTALQSVSKEIAEAVLIKNKIQAIRYGRKLLLGKV
jgi:hypothetical protein